MTAIPGTRLAEMRLDKVVATSAQQGHASFFVVLDGVSQDRQLPILIGETEAIALSASLTRRLFARPMSPQFAAGLVHALGGRVGQVRIDRLVACPRWHGLWRHCASGRPVRGWNGGRQAE